MSNIYETIKTVNGFDIYRMIGTHGFYHIRIKDGCEINFRTIKAAAAWAAAQTR